jgi:hypothetical protein
VDEYGGGDQTGVKPRDPLVRFLGGCAVVAAVVAALVLLCAWYIGWSLSRDPSPGRKPETFLTGDETRYWCAALRPDDAGLQALFKQLDTIGEESRAKALHGTFLESMPLPRRHARLDLLAPLTLEGSLFMSGPSTLPQAPAGWAARATLSHDVLRVRATLKVMRWMLSRNPEKADTIDVDGVAITEVHDNHAAFALANLGNRVLAASDASRLRAVFGAPAAPPHPELLALHEEVKLDGEDGWALISGAQLDGPSTPLSIAAAAASFDVDDRDELLFRVAVTDRAAVPEGRPFSGTRDDCVAVASSFLPIVGRDAIEIDGDGAQPFHEGSKVFTGRVRDLSKYLPGLPKRLAEVMVRSAVSARETPSASPTPPSPPSSGGPRIDTPAGPRHEGSPKPPR